MLPACLWAHMPARPPLRGDPPLDSETGARCGRPARNRGGGDGASGPRWHPCGHGGGATPRNSHRIIAVTVPRKRRARGAAGPPCAAAAAYGHPFRPAEAAAARSRARSRAAAARLVEERMASSRSGSSAMAA
jgi:hypothetical protein